MLGFRLDPGMNPGESALDWIEIRSLEVTSEDSTLHVELGYVIRQTGQAGIAQFSGQV